MNTKKKEEKEEKKGKKKRTIHGFLKHIAHVVSNSRLSSFDQ